MQQTERHHTLLHVIRGDLAVIINLLKILNVQYAVVKPFWM